MASAFTGLSGRKAQGRPGALRPSRSSAGRKLGEALRGGRWRRWVTGSAGGIGDDAADAGGRRTDREQGEW